MGDRSRGIALLPVLAFVLAFVLLPAIYVLGVSIEGVDGGAGLAGALGDPVTQRAAWNSLEQGGLSALLAGALGYPLGIILGRFTFRGRDVLGSFLLVPFLLPSLVVILGFEELFGAGGWISSGAPALGVLGSGLPGILGVNVYFNAAMVALLTRTAVGGSSREQEEAAAVLGASPARVYLETWGPVSWVGAAAGMLLTFILSALGFAAPLLICGAQCFTLEVRIWSLAEIIGQPAIAGVVALATVGLLSMPTVLYLRSLAGMRRRTAPHARPDPPLSPRTPIGAIATGYLALFFLGLAGLLVAIVARSVDPTGSAVDLHGWAELFGSGLAGTLGVSTAQATINTLALAGGAALLALLLAIVTGFARRTGLARGGSLEYLLFLPLLVSPVLLAFGLATVWRPLLGGTSSTWFLILVSQASVALPFTVQSLRLSLDRLTAAPWEAARVLGSGPFEAYLETDLSRARAGLLGAVLFAFAIGLGEFTATFFLVTPPWTTLPVELERLESLRLGAASDALGALLLLVSLVAFAAIELGGRRAEL
jgi:thiamine transport system permease protein